jgi:hypothetical protein
MVPSNAAGSPQDLPFSSGMSVLSLAADMVWLSLTHNALLDIAGG